MNKDYVSEFTLFMDRYLKEHPEVVEDQARGFDIFWHPRIDPGTPVNGNGIAVPDDHYGFTTLFEAPRVKKEKPQQGREA